jgi:cytochrome c-type biogenesis protein CcmH
VNTLIGELRKKQPDLPEAEATTEQVASMASGLKVRVTLDPQRSAEVEAGQLLYIYAKAEQGPPMPLAAKRLKVSDLPAEVTLSDSDAMMANMAMSAFERVVVGARISKTGNPIAQPGDLYTESEGVAHKGFDGVVELTIDQVKQ